MMLSKALFGLWFWFYDKMDSFTVNDDRKFEAGTLQ